MNGNTLRRFVGKLNKSEYDAYLYLKNKGVDVDIIKSKQAKGRPDLIGDKCYEVKRIYSVNQSGTWNDHVIFQKAQVTNFNDDVVVLFFYPFENIPRREVLFGKFKDLITKSGSLSMNKLDKKLNLA